MRRLVSPLQVGNVAQGQSGRFISARSLVRTQPLPPRSAQYRRVELVISKDFRGRLAQLARASRSHREGHWFESSTAHHVDISCGR